MLMATQPGSVVTYLGGYPVAMSHKPSVTWFCNVTWQIFYIFTGGRHMAIKHGEVVTHHEWNPPINSPITLNVVMQQIKKHVLSMTNPIVTKPVRVVTLQETPTHKFKWPISKMILWGNNNLNNLKAYLHLQKILGHQTRHGPDIPQEAHSLKDPLITWPTWSHMTSWKICISTFI